MHKKMLCYKRLFSGIIFFSTLQSNFLEATEFNSFEKPFDAQSLWNSRPVNPVFDSFVIPTSIYYPAIQDGKYSTRCFLATEHDAPMLLKPALGKQGINDADAEILIDELVIPHWPADLIPAEGEDGHADIFDTANGIIYSFWQLKKVDGVWRTTHVGWTPLNGSGWGDPAHYHQGARAAGVASCAGIIRSHELNDGKEMYSHALAISLTNNALAATPPYTFPATIADADAQRNTGNIPEGALLMLPADFDTSKITNAEVRKVANTLKVYGAYVVDMNYGTPFVVYAEIGSGLKMHKSGWDSAGADELHKIRLSLRMVKSASGWIDGDGKPFTPNKALNLLSMRGPWIAQNGQPLGQFVPLRQAVVFDKTNVPVVQSNYSDRSIPPSYWANPRKGDTYQLKVTATGGATLMLKLIDSQTKQTLYESPELGSEETVKFAWPTDSFTSILTVKSGVGDSSSVRGTLILHAN